jgi:hypothetical protein
MSSRSRASTINFELLQVFAAFTSYLFSPSFFCKCLIISSSYTTMPRNRACSFATDTRLSGRTAYLPVPFRLISYIFARFSLTRADIPYSDHTSDLPLSVLHPFCIVSILFSSHLPPPFHDEKLPSIRSFHSRALRVQRSTPPMPNIYIPPCARRTQLVLPSVGRQATGALGARWGSAR